MRGAMSRPRCDGFTLVELLAVMAIISLLMSMLLPGMDVARRKARGAVCLSNLRQIHIAIEDYRATNDEFIPGAFTGLAPRTGGWDLGLVETAWAGPLDAAPGFAHYCKDAAILRCPEVTEAGAVSYGRNGRVRVGRFPQVRDPSRIPLAFDGKSERGLTYADVDNRHVGAANMLYADGHVLARPFNAESTFTQMSLPGVPDGDEFVIWISAVSIYFKGSVSFRLLEDGSPIETLPVPMSKYPDPRFDRFYYFIGQGESDSLYLDPKTHAYAILMTGSDPVGGSGIAAGSARINGGTAFSLDLVRSPATTSMTDITAALRAAAPE